MDFSSLMSSALSKSKRPVDQDKKYVKRSEVEAQRRDAYLAEQKALEAERAVKAATKRRREEEAGAVAALREEKRRRLAEESRRRREEEEKEEERARRKRLGLPERTTAHSTADEEDIAESNDMSEEELADKLRALGEPVVLFGEGHASRLRRYRKLVMKVSTGPVPTTLELVEEKDMKVDGTVPKDREARKWLFRQLASYFSMVLATYEQTMEAEKTDTTASRQAYSAMVQTRESMKPVRPPHFIITRLPITDGRLALPKVRIR